MNEVGEKRRPRIVSANLATTFRSCPSHCRDSRNRRILFGLIVVFLVSVVVVACGGSESSKTEPSESGAGSSVEVECEVEGYPCSFAEVPLEILERSDELGDEALAMIDGGASTAEAASWLEEQSDMAEVQSDDLAVRFRVEGGRAIWILREGAFATRSAPGSESAAPLPSVRTDAAETSARRAVARRHVVNENSDEKKALILSPMFWQFGQFDDGPVVEGILQGTRGYEGRVEFESNKNRTDKSVGVASFTGWGAYDVVHVSSHGKVLCDEEGCRAVIHATTVDAALPPGPESKEEKLKKLTQNGVEYSKGEKSGIEYLVLTADFFREENKSGALEDTFIFFSACQSFDSDLVQAIKGNTSVFLGWDQPVYSGESTAAAKALYEDLGERGYPAEIAYENLGSLRSGSPYKDYPGATLQISERGDGGDLRIREVVTLLNPATGQELVSSDQVAIAGTADDGEPDIAPYLVQVDGVKAEFAGDMLVHVEIDGIEADPQPLSNGTANNEDQWTIGGKVELGYDLEDDKNVTFRAWAELHSGGESDHEVPATLTGSSECIVGTWQVHNDDVRVLHDANVGDVSKSVSVNGAAAATFESDGTVSFLWNGWELMNTIETPPPIEGMNTLFSIEAFISNGTAQGTYVVSGDLLEMIVGDFDTEVTLFITLNEDVIANTPQLPDFARLFLIPTRALPYQCSDTTLTTSWEPGQTIRWNRVSD